MTGDLLDRATLNGFRNGSSKQLHSQRLGQPIIFFQALPNGTIVSEMVFECRYYEDVISLNKQHWRKFNVLITSPREFLQYIA